MDTEQWLADFQRRVDDLRGKSLRLREQLTEAAGTVTSPDGLVRVTAGPGGALRSLHIDERAMSGTASRLTDTIMRTFGQAQAKVAHEVAGALEPLAGDTEVMEVVRSFLPPVPEGAAEDEPAAGTESRAEAAEDDEADGRPW
ncbi:YbaB/EbfC family nucleoid-associated protein [Amycolatopsis thermophila]|uniref:DNA-binding protein YbaB n=1 Tax=Amycolatopsis thermophila TaxID=206084 RepID=A0ABU0F2W0_9PSEU|nr:YbaB/EbfC family nucleoid-associated protein [Amycolatopsis thermophila]MDQ0381902.1 DNA-binding protein YbaB [Amycolatopsis thermophila]